MQYLKNRCISLPFLINKKNTYVNLHYWFVPPPPSITPFSNRNFFNLNFFRKVHQMFCFRKMEDDKYIVFQNNVLFAVQNLQISAEQKKQMGKEQQIYVNILNIVNLGTFFHLMTSPTMNAWYWLYPSLNAIGGTEPDVCWIIMVQRPFCMKRTSLLRPCVFIYILGPATLTFW